MKTATVDPVDGSEIGCSTKLWQVSDVRTDLINALNANIPEIKIRMVNIVDLMKLEPQSEHPHGLSDADFDFLILEEDS